MLQTLEKNLKNVKPEHLLYNLLKTASKSMVEITESNLVFTDDLAPVELIGFKVLHQLIREGFRELVVRGIYAAKDYF